MTNNIHKPANVRITLILVLLAGAVGAIPERASAETNHIFSETGFPYDGFTLNLNGSASASFQADTWDMQLVPDRDSLFSPKDREVLSPLVITTIGNWFELGNNGSGSDSLNTSAYTFGLLNGKLYVGGKFTNVNNNDTVLNNTDLVAAYEYSGIHFAVIGDYGFAGQPELEVANLVRSWNPDFVITVGDNNYEAGSATTIDQNIGQYYYDFIYPYMGSYGAGAATNRFFPSLGNHDWSAVNAQPYLNYFSLPGNERYYDYVKGPVHFFVIDSDSHEPDGISSNSTQAVWLKNKLANSIAQWNIVYMHHPPYSSGLHGSTPVLQWPFTAWGVDAVLTGHDHIYERIYRGSIPYFVNGLGGKSITTFGASVLGSQVQYNADYGAMLVDASDLQITFQFVSRNGTIIDTYTLATQHPSSFLDVPVSHPYYDDIETLYANGYTAGCSTSPLKFCPDVSMSRAQAAVFMLRGNFGGGYVPVTPAHFFADNWVSALWGEGWAESMYLEGLTAGCSASPLRFCPYDILTNAQLAVFGLRLKYGMAYAPAPATGTVFADLTDVNFWGTAWAEQAYADGLIPACGTSGGKPLFCGDDLVSRGFGAYVIVKAKNLTMP